MDTQEARPLRATIYDVAKVAEVSPSTVSRVLAGRKLVAAATRERVLAVATQMGYRTNAVARSLSRRNSDIVAAVLPDITNPFFSELVKALQSAALEHGYTMLICYTEADAELERLYLDGLLSRQVEYVFAVGLTLDRATLESYVSAGLVFIALDRPIQYPKSFLVQSDNRKGAEIAVRHLIDLGHRRIAHIAGPSNVPQSRDRRRGYIDALVAANRTVEEDLVVESDFCEQGGADALAELERRGVEYTAVFAADDMIAIGALSAAREAGRSVPEDLSIVGFDDVLPARYTTPPLTTVRQDADAMAKQAVQLIVSPETPRRRHKIVLPVSLQVRGSTSLSPNGSATLTRR